MTYQRGDLGSFGVSYKVAPETTETVINAQMCFQVNGTKDSTILPQIVIPDLTEFTVCCLKLTGQCHTPLITLLVPRCTENAANHRYRRANETHHLPVSLGGVSLHSLNALYGEIPTTCLKLRLVSSRHGLCIEIGLKIFN